MLYFDNLSRDSSDAYLADGLTEEVIARLGQVGRLTVKSRGMVQRYRGQPGTDPATVGRALGVANLVSGSVRRAGNQLRVTVEMVRAASGVHVWGDVFTRADGDVFAIQEEIARAVATQVAGRLAPAERATLTARPTRSTEAYDRFLRGNYYLAQRTPERVRRAIDEFEAAARLDPSFVSAVARIGLAYGVHLSWGWDYPGVSRDSQVARGLAAAQRAIRSDSVNADAWLALASVLEQAGSDSLNSAVIAGLERAIALDPRNAEAYHLLGWNRIRLGNDRLAEIAYRQALVLEPARPITLEHLARLAIAQRRDTAAEALLDSALAVDPGFFMGYVGRAMVRARLGKIALAQRDAETAASLPGNVPSAAEAALARVAAAADPAAARRRLAPLLANPGSMPAVWIVVAPALVAAGDTAAALATLERAASAAAERPGTAHFWLRSPDYDPLRGSVRFARIVESVTPRRER